MGENLLHVDASFRERIAVFRPLLPKDQVRSLDDLFEHLRRFTAVRRHEIRLARLEDAGRIVAADWRSNRKRVPDAIKSFSEALRLLSEHAIALQPLIVSALDDVIALAAEDGHPLVKMLHDSALSVGFSSDEVAWLFDELKAVDYRPVHLVCANGFEDLMTLLASISVGEAGLLVAGFVRLTGDPGLDDPLEKLVIRLSEKGVTASIFLVLAIVVTAHAVAVYCHSHNDNS